MLEDCEFDDDDYESDEVQNDGVLMLKGAPTGAQKLAPGSQKGAPTGALNRGTFLCPVRCTFDSQ